MQKLHILWIVGIFSDNIMLCTVFFRVFQMFCLNIRREDADHNVQVAVDTSKIEPMWQAVVK